jgi:hypothetical protein
MLSAIMLNVVIHNVVATTAKQTCVLIVQSCLKVSTTSSLKAAAFETSLFIDLICDGCRRPNTFWSKKHLVEWHLTDEYLPDSVLCQHSCAGMGEIEIFALSNLLN